MHKKQFLFLLQHPPYGSNLTHAGLEAILATGVFDQIVSVLFVDDGIFALLKDQQPEDISQKCISAQLQALELYGISNVFADKKALENRGIKPNELCLPVTLLDDVEIAQLIQQHDILLNF